MFNSKKEIESLKKKVEDQDQLIREVLQHLSHLSQEINELKKPKEPNYFG